MDPDACYRQILADIASNSFGDANDGVQNLLEWIRKGGFTPACFTSSEVALQTLNALDNLLGYT